MTMFALSYAVCYGEVMSVSNRLEKVRNMARAAYVRPPHQVVIRKDIQTGNFKRKYEEFQKKWRAAVLELDRIEAASEKRWANYFKMREEMALKRLSKRLCEGCARRVKNSVKCGDFKIDFVVPRKTNSTSPAATRSPRAPTHTSGSSIGR
jgi:hypothetical protein